MKILEKFLSEEIKFPSEQVSVLMGNFEKYNSLLMDWNSKINLISRQNSSIETNVLNSIFFLTKYKLNKQAQLADIGTGGGFPGIPLKILYNNLDVLLIDSVTKKILAVKDIIEKLSFEKLSAASERAESLSLDKKYRNKFNYVTSKAVAPLEKIYSWSENFLAKDGVCLCIKGGDIKDEINELKQKKMNIELKVIDYSFPEIYNIEDKKLVTISRKAK